jgi:RND family efflux transporter MFP subunit
MLHIDSSRRREADVTDKSTRSVSIKEAPIDLSRLESGAEVAALQTLRAVLERLAVAKRLECGGFSTAFLRASCQIFLLAFLATGGMPLKSHAAEPLIISGITEPFMNVTLGAAVAGIVHSEFFKEGETVKQGTVILELNKELEELEVERRKAVMDQNKMELDSTRALLQTTKSVSKEALSKKEAEYNVSAAESGIAQQQLAQRQIVAPFSGVITEILLHPGEACAPYEPLVRLVDTTRCYFIGQVEGKAAAALRLDQPMRIEVEGAPEAVIGKISFISPVVDPASGLAKVKAIFENANAKIRPGLAARMIPQ